MSTSPSTNQQLLRERSAGWNPVLTCYNLLRIVPFSAFGPTFFVLAFFALAFAQMPVRADLATKDATGPWVGDSAIGEARLVSAVTGTADLQELPLGLEFRLAPGWKIYWRTPGEAGLPPQLELQLASGHAVTNDMHWPVPRRFDAFGFDNFGYANKVILPVTLRGHPKGVPVQIIGQIEALVCADICVPLNGEIGLTIPEGPATASRHAMEIARYKARIPRGGASPIKVEAIWQDGNNLRVQFDANGPVVDDIFVEGAPGIAFKKPFYASGVASIAFEGKLDTPLTGKMLDLTIVAGEMFVSGSHVVVNEGPLSGSLSDAVTGRAFENGSMWAIAAIAFLGGLILNLMPCVLPVLAIKLAAIIDSSGQSRGLVRMRFAAGAAGILASFGMGAVGLAAMRFAGGQIGWGIQFQSPIFLTMMMFVLGLFTLNMLDRFFLPVPSFLAVPSSLQPSDRSGPSGIGTYAWRRLLAGDFTAGMLATLLATPCSAPFVGSAVTVALSSDDILQLFSIFMAMGAGLAAPWVTVALFPDLLTFLPKPGPWMSWLKRGLAGLLMATMVWIGWLLAAVQGGIAAVLIICLVGLVLMTILWRRKFAFLIAVTGLFTGLWALPPPAVSNSSSGAGLVWQPWSENARKAAQDDGKLVLLDITADWCITCKANKQFVLEREPVAGLLSELLDDSSLVMLQADWTRPDPRILAFLASHQRFGIPFNIIYGPAAPNGIVLGELLSARMIEQALINAGMKR